MIPIRDEIQSKTYPAVTHGIIGLNVLVFVFQLMQGENIERFITTYGLVPARYTVPEIASQFTFAEQAFALLSFMFLHGGVLHLVGNMWSLYIFGDNVEDRMGSTRYLAFYLLSGWASGLAHLWFNWGSTVPTIGASGAIAGVMGAYFILFPGARIITLIPILFIPYFVEIPAVVFLGIWLLFQFFYASLPGQEGVGGIAWWAHIGGFVFGMIAVKLFSRLPESRLDEKLHETLARRTTPRLQRLLPVSESDDLDLHGTIVITAREARNGTRKMISVPGDAARRAFMVRIPPGTEDGTRIRLAGLGRTEGGRAGDIYLEIRVEE
ncbi:MAG: rhomboid family intramembrane serine protease [Syntrophaceae bacterium]|nr:rhomboid family intramembrane serine protease [Syntrophaceae bacterium]